MTEKDLIIAAVTLIKQWHNMHLDETHARRLWTLYWLNAPEMQQFRDYYTLFNIQPP